MRNALRSIATVLSFVILLTQFAHAATPSHKISAALANSNSQVPAQADTTAPVPSQIAAAHNIFLTNDGSDPNFPGTSTESYNAVYAALQSWGHYQLVSTPAQADLIFQLRNVAPISSVTGTHGNVYSITSPAFQLTIVDPASNVALWTISSPVDLSGKAKERSKWYAISVANLVSRVKVIAGQSLSNVETAELSTAPPNHQGRAALILVGGFLLLAVGTGFLMKHEFDKSVQKQNAQLCASNPFFCTNP
jgi:hypothetical protein